MPAENRDKRGWTERKTLPDQVFAYALLTFWQRAFPSKNTCSFEDLAYSAGSPGKVFKMSDSEITQRLERIAPVTRGALSYDETAGLKQVYRHKDIASKDILNEYFQPVGATV